MNRRRLLAALPLAAIAALLDIAMPTVALASDEGDDQSDDSSDDDSSDDDSSDDDSSDDDSNDDDGNDDDSSDDGDGEDGDDEDDEDDEDGDDHEEARRSVQNGQAISLAALLAIAAPYIDGDLINVRLIKRRGTLIYELTVLGPTGKVSKLYFLAKDGTKIER